eukprot:gene10050-20936_t
MSTTSILFDTLVDKTLTLTPLDYAVVFVGVIGLVVLSSWMQDFFFKGIYGRLFRPNKNIKHQYGAWVVVTGATDGIGKAMAFEFARRKCNVVLISRSKEKLEGCAAELKKKFSDREVLTMDVDFSKFDEAERKRVDDLLKNLDIGVLVNNVGVSYQFPKYFNELDDERVEHLITLNVNSTTWMTRVVLPGMLQRKRGAIINISSAAGVSTSPLLAQYGAAKSYIAMFSKALNAELQGKGVHVQCQIPLYVATKLAKLRNTSLFVASPTAYARSAVDAIGYEVVVSPYWSHALQLWAMAHFPHWIVTSLTFSMHQGIRAAGLKKETRQANGHKEKHT